jgi:hypothetical protein
MKSSARFDLRIMIDLVMAPVDAADDEAARHCGTIRRRILVNFRAAADVMHAELPEV